MKNYLLRFGSGNPSSVTGLTPTFTLFNVMPGTSALVAPGITESPAGSGLYVFQYGPTLPISFICDGGVSLATSARYLVGVLDPIQAVNEYVGVASSSIGTTNVDPTTLFGYAKRNLENLEGNATFDKQTGVWNILTRGGTLIQTKVLANAAGSVTKA